MTPESRRALVERIFDKARKSGQTIDDDARFIGWIENWIEGDIEIADLREKYRELLLSRRHTKKGE
ncbi:hypothetical protein GAO09_02245 [Rhizobiales bacterium RZME27]|uniref:Antitoxin VbhA domain-containing protein n=1 Tax=Endobacterium cereale TaxID=2663029 RepID=A0A6A8A327_9HYPH|nr:hypothetical protein [Endobacterium cereale]MEB2844982.1 hypothetical protein [Endobacterium cereale]MQY44894.1 hypothetical protein [Endobacterium cereale]